MKRRNFLWYSTALSAAVIIPVIGCESGKVSVDSIAIPLTLSNIYNKEAMISTGKAYLEMFQEEKNKNVLEIQLLKDFNMKKGVNQLSNEEFVMLIEQKVKADFEQSKIVIVDGWVLSKTEARQCAYFSLIN